MNRIQRASSPALCILCHPGLIGCPRRLIHHAPGVASGVKGGAALHETMGLVVKANGAVDEGFAAVGFLSHAG